MRTGPFPALERDTSVPAATNNPSLLPLLSWRWRGDMELSFHEYEAQALRYRSNNQQRCSKQKREHPQPRPQDSIWVMSASLPERTVRKQVPRAPPLGQHPP